ncbi:aminoacyl-tRNA hydrolase [Ktedonobacter racemifer]|uniref:Peptidyl-tRNA hydrolase n=1 Tax=Ktedonobacter racemifer DSM 44963 TaxID=485913 RepID=D6TKL2_KTERA|nr:aminoacyl-tRNA hydrolase [Ktedonobacter racemifer]EFH86312.1 peptidyl-tRNA hydrolase [Ktedonobacter racemifer DSM 44963]
MKLLVGLGNPGAQYERTRHNVGFRVIDALAEKLGVRWERRGRAMIANATLEHEKVVLVKPITFMNNSGEAVGELQRWFKLEPEDILVVYDELDLPVGQLRVRARGSAGGHNGMKSLIQYLHTDQFPRLRVGIGRPANRRLDTINYVLGIPPKDEYITLLQTEDKALEAFSLILREGLDQAMNTLNVDPEAQRKAEEKRRLKQEREAARQQQATIGEKQAEDSSSPRA